MAGSYGLMMSGGRLGMIAATGCLGPEAAVSAPSVTSCGDGQSAVLAPPVGASNSRVYYRDGDTTIRFLQPDGGTGVATTVPGGPTTVSFFSVSPDDTRIAVLVEDVSVGTSINLRLHVEDLAGGAHHADIYSTSIAKAGGVTLWPRGWQGGNLVLGVVQACSSSPTTRVTQWHLVSATTANRIATIDGGNCDSSFVPSAFGIACATPDEIRIFN